MARMTAYDPNVWSSRALQEDFFIWRRAVLHQYIRPLIGACCAPGHHGYQRACDLITGQASTGHSGHQVFARTGKTDPPSHLILSQTSAGNRLWDYVIAGSLSVQFLCSCHKAVLSSRHVFVLTVIVVVGIWREAGSSMRGCSA